MKILIVSNNDGSTNGWGRYTEDLKSALLELGHEVKSVEDISGARLSNPLKYLSRFEFCFFEIFRLKICIRKFNPDVIHFTVEPYMLLIPFLSKKIKTKIILTVHGTYAYIPALFVESKIRRYFYTLIIRKTFSRISECIAVSNFTKNHLIELSRHDYLDLQNKAVVIPNGIHTDISISISKVNNDKKLILMVGAIKERKGLRESLQALSTYKKNFGGDFVYKIIGSYYNADTYYKELITLIKDLDLNNEVIFLGKISESDLIKEYSSADLYLMLPIEIGGSFEGFGLVYLEAGLYGVPVIGSLNSGAEDAISDGVSGYLVDPNFPEDVAKKMHEILDNKKINSNSCIKWAKEHDVKKIALSIVNNVYSKKK